MATFDRYVLRLRAPLHLAGRGIGIEASELTVRSDTLFSALCVGIAATRGADTLDDLLFWYREGEPPFILGSAFPWAGDTFFLPRPRLLAPGGASRRARWVSAGVLERLIAGDAPDDTAVPIDPGAENPTWVLPEERRALETGARWSISTVPRVTVDRVTQASAIYRAGRTVFGPAAGLYFLVRWREPAWQPAFDDALAYLADAGLGGERSAGHGQFVLDRHDETNVADRADSPRRMTLGLYHPTAADVANGALDPPAAYDLEVRRGWTTDAVGGGVWRRSVRMLAEGALVQRVGDIAGELVDVTPVGFAGHRIVRSGLTLTLGVPDRLDGGDR